MGETHRIHVHRLDELYILDTLRRTESPSALRTERMAVHSLDDNLRSVDVNAIRLTVFDCPEAELLMLTVEHLAVLVEQFEHSLISVWSLGSPQ